ncbi:unknown [Feldmannia species virus]|uniref:Uncharacterized protein n=1 Tax=Feldmannia species virus TaxID=39420 RepID=B5LWL1_9PHYC|nr:hypothetical protein FeldSpV_gp122 [Feldmannia species virus]ACH46874.1 unknown [Feldmannia species virus]
MEMKRWNEDREMVIDIALLAILVALNVSGKDSTHSQNLQLIVMALLFAHVVMTTDLHPRGKPPGPFSNEKCETSRDKLGTPRRQDSSRVDPRIIAKARASYFDDLGGEV